MEFIPTNRLLTLPSDAIENIRKIHGLDKPGRLEEAITILEEWIQKQDHIIKKDFSKDYLEKTLISCKGSVEKAKKQIDSSCTMRTLLPKYFTLTNISMELNDTMKELAWVLPLPKLTKDLYRIVLVKVKGNNIPPDGFMHYCQFCINLCEYIKANDYANGFIVIHDYTEINVLEIIAKTNTTQLQDLMSILTEGYGARIKGIHLITESKAIELLVKTFRTLVSEKIGNRIFVHPTLEDLHKDIPKEILPVEYGGKEISVEKLYDEWYKELSSEKHIEYLNMMQKACTDETKRTAGKFNEEYLGMPGSFRNLSVD